MSTIEREAEIVARLPDAELLQRLRESTEIGSEQTRRTYMLGLKRAKEQVSKEAGREVSYSEMLLRPEETVRRLKSAEGWSSSTLKGTMNAIRSLIKHAKLTEDMRAGGRFSRMSKRWKELINGVEVKAKTDAKEIKWTDVLAKTDELEARARKLSTSKGATSKEAQTAWMEALQLSMYSDLLPRRHTDYYRLYVLRSERDRERAEKQEASFVDMTARALRENGGVPLVMVKKYKTAKSLGEWRKAMPSRTYELLKRSLEAQPREYVFVGADGRPYALIDAYTKSHNGRLERWFGESANLRAIRHSAASMLHSNPMITPLERESGARDMGHSVKISGQVYATSTAPTARGDGSYNAVMTGPDGRPTMFVCRPAAAEAAAKKRPMHKGRPHGQGV